MASCEVPQSRRARIVTMMRTSSYSQGDTTESIRERLTPIAIGLSQFCIRVAHPAVHGTRCGCVFDEVQHVILPGVPSNTNLLTSVNKYVKELRRAIQVPYLVILCSTGHDGGFTNLTGYMDFIRTIQKDGTGFHHLFWRAENDYDLYDAEKILSAFSPQTPLTSDSFFLREVSRVGLNKALVSKASQANAVICTRKRHSQIPGASLGKSTPQIECKSKRQREVLEVDFYNSSKAQRREDASEKLRLAHYPIKCKDDRYMCPCCNQDFASEKLVVTHLVQKGGSSFTCVFCERPSKQGKALRQHLRKHVEDRQECGIDGCTFQPNSPSLMDEHRSTIHTSRTNEKDEWTCSFCGKKLASQKAHYAHERAHKDPEVECQYCEELINHSNMKHHQQYDCEARPRVMSVCPVCGFRTDQNHMARHLEKHQQTNEVMGFTVQHDFEYGAGMYGDIIQKES